VWFILTTRTRPIGDKKMNRILPKRSNQGRLRNFGHILLLISILFWISAGTRVKAGPGDVFRKHSLASFGDGTADTALPVLNENSTLSDYLAIAAGNNPGLKSAYNRWQSAREKIIQAHSLPDPTFSYTFMVRPVETRVGPQRQKFSVSQRFPWFGKRDLRAAAALEGAKAEEERYRATKLALFFQVKKAFWEVAYLGQSIEITLESIKLLTYLENIVRSRYKTSLARYADVIKAQVVLAKLEDRLSTLRDLRAPLAARLNAALNRPTDSLVPWPKQMETRPVSFTDDQLYQKLRVNNPELKGFDKQAHRQMYFRELARKAHRPDVTVGLEYIDTGGTRMPGVPDSGKNSLGFKISVNIPLWRDKTNAIRREAVLRHLEILDQKKEWENNLLAELKLALFGFRDAERKIGLYRDTLVPKAEQSFNASQKEFTAGKADFLDILDSQQTLLEYQLGYQRALSDRAIHLANVEMMVGEQFPATLAQMDAENIQDGNNYLHPSGIGGK